MSDDGPGITQWLYPAFDIVLCRAEAEGYFHNVSTTAPNVFVLWRMEDGRAVPRYVTVSYDEASRWMDGGAQVDSVAMPSTMRDWVRGFVEEHYRPEPKKRIRPKSFLAPKERQESGERPVEETAQAAEGKGKADRHGNETAGGIIQ